MKKFLLSLTVVLLSLAVHGQISVTNADMPVAGDTIRMSTGIGFLGMDPTLTGTDYNWDYSKLTMITQTIDSFLDVNSTDPAYALFFFNISFNKNRSNLAQRGASFDIIPGFSVDQVFNFYYNSSSRYEQTGYGAAINGLTIPTAYAPHDTIYHFPMTFGKVDSSFSGNSINIPDIFTYTTQTFRHNEADGWGSLTTPYGTFDALRVKTIISAHDSIYLDTLSFGFGIPMPQQIQYKWLGKGQGEPLLQINTTAGIVTQILYRDSARSNILNIGIINNEELAMGPVIFPNPSCNVQSLVYSLKEAADVKIEVFDMMGNKIVTLADEHQAADKHVYTLNVADSKFSSGVYMLRLSVNGKNYLEKLLVQK